MRNKFILPTFSRNTSPYDVDGVVQVNVSGNNFVSVPEVPFIHGMLYYNGYIYGSARSPWLSTGIMEFLKLKADNYSDINTIPIYYGYEGDPQPIYYMEQLSISGVYIYAGAYASVSGTRTNLIIQIDTRDDSYKIFKITNAYGIAQAAPIYVDDTYLYFNPFGSDEDTFLITTTLLKYSLADFQDEKWDKFETDYDDNGVDITPVDTLVLYTDSYYLMHSIIGDDDYLYLGMMWNDLDGVTPGKLLKIDKALMTVSSTADIPAATSDGIVQTSTHIFLGGEAYFSDYGGTWATVAVRKSDMNVTALLKHSTEDSGKSSYGVCLFNIGGVDYLFNMRTDKRIYLMAIDQVDSWSIGGSSDSYILKILSFEYSDAPVVHAIPNELVMDNDKTFHCNLFGTISELFKFRIRMDFI